MKLRILLSAALVCLLNSCASSGTQGLAPLIEKPVSPALIRFQQLEAGHPGLAEFVKKQGRPDFTNETKGARGSALMLYYLKPGKAWLCVMKSGSKDAAILGPEPIGQKELTFLKAAKALQE